MDKPNELRGVYEELLSAIITSRSIAYACQSSHVAGELTGALDAAFCTLDDAMKLLEGNAKLFGFASEVANG